MKKKVEEKEVKVKTTGLKKEMLTVHIKGTT